MGLTFSGGRELQRKLKRQEREMKRAQAGALGEAATVMERDMRSRVFPVRRVSKQDAPAGRTISLAGQSPVRTTVTPSRGEAVVRVNRHWTTARTPAVQSVFARFGLADKLVRKGLYVSRDHDFIKFSDPANPNLIKWATKRGQVRRHVVRLSDPRVISALQVKPTVSQAFPKIHRIWLDASRRVLRS